MDTLAPTRELTVDVLRGSSRRRRKERLTKLVLQGASVFSLVVSVAILLAMAGQAIRWLTGIELGWLWTSAGWSPRRNDFDILTLFIGTVMVAGIAMLVAAPLGLGAALYLSEYATPRIRRILKPILEVLASIPSVVLGFFALTVIQPTIVVGLIGGKGAFSYLSAGIAVGILTVPLVASVSEDAMYA